MTDNFVRNSHKEFLNSLISGNRLTSSKLANNILNQRVSIKELYENIIKKALYDIGVLWEFNKISVATEHLASAIVEAILNELYLKVISEEKINKTVITACVENEFHQIGIKMVSDVFEMNGWNVHFLGANTPAKELIDFIKITKPDVLALSLSIYFNLPVLENMIQMIRKEFPVLPILVGGQAFRHGSQNVLLKYDNVIYKSDLNSTDLFIKTLNQNG
ncbi:MAG: cobalamin-dependent protein [Ignavibacteriae bacterium]|jgi:methanogenic corrinoid protein MtbC1|nr:cobalamin-dependent protein [Ignavibacteriota bacterium]